MTLRRAFLRDSELDRSTYAELRDRVVEFEQDPPAHETRSYSGYPKVALQRCRPRRLVGLDGALASRRTRRRLGTALPSRATLSRLLQFAHGITAGEGRGPVPSSGGLQALELYAAVLSPSWLEAGVYHYDRAGHHLSRLPASGDRARWADLVPSMALVEGGSLVWIVAGDGGRIGEKYGDRAGRFLLLEAGHLMQNLCVVSESLGLCTVPLGAALEPEIARELGLPAADAVLYTGLCGPVD